MEWWIGAGLVLALFGLGVVNRLRRSRAARSEGERKTIYPLW